MLVETLSVRKGNMFPTNEETLMKFCGIESRFGDVESFE